MTDIFIVLLSSLFTATEKVRYFDCNNILVLYCSNLCSFALAKHVATKIAPKPYWLNIIG